MCGLFAQLTAGKVTVGIYAFNPESGSRYGIVSRGVSSLRADDDVRDRVGDADSVIIVMPRRLGVIGRGQPPRRAGEDTRGGR